MQSLQIIDLVILAFVEGVADVLPVDSSAHALLASWLFQWRAGAIGIAIHLGAAAALALYLWRDLALIANGLWRLRKRRIESGTRLGAKALATALPWMLAAAYIGNWPGPTFSALALVGGITIFCAIVMIFADRMSMTVQRIEHLSPAGILVMALFQLFAIVPGVGRVAALATMARLLGLERESAFRFVLLVQIPILLAAAATGATDYWAQGVRLTEGDVLGFVVTLVCVLPTVAIGTAWMRRHGLVPFAIYRLFIGAGLLAIAFL